MVRSRSRSPRRDRSRRSRSRERDRRRDRERGAERDRRPRSRSRSPRRRDKRSRSTSEDTDKNESGSKTFELQSKPNVTNADLEGKTPDEQEMMKLMGFCGFDSTKGKKVDGNDGNYAANILQKRRYRQYMNRKGGFNRPLDYVI